jgi:antitoxin component HigA of HigAB toxin-antitoxin module
MIIKQIMANTSVTQSDLSRWCGINQSRISLLLNKRVKPTDTEILKLETFFKLPLRVLFGEGEEEDAV